MEENINGKNEARLMKGNEALAEAAIRADIDAYFGYPITPQSEILEYFTLEMPKRHGVVLQAESELAAINMVYGAAGAGGRVMTSSSSPGISLMQEAISYIASAELPCLLVNVTRGGPGLGTIQPSQGDYFQAVKGGGHGDYHLIVLAPSSVQEMADFVFDAIRLSEKYRIPAMILSDGALGQMMEKVVLPVEGSLPKPEKNWATAGKPATRERNIITSLFIDPEKMEGINIRLQEKYEKLREEVRFEEIALDDAEFALVAFGLSARVCQKAVDLAREKGIRVGLLRPITLYPFPKEAISNLAQKVNFFLVVEMNAGQMVEDVALAVNGKRPVYFKGRMGGMVPTPEDVLEKLESLVHTLSTSEIQEGTLMQENIQQNGFEVVYKKPVTLTDTPFHYCPGCGHSVVHRVLMEVVDEMGIQDKTIGVAPVGCSVFAYSYMNIDMQEAAHGRASAVATGIKRIHPDKFVFSYQGDGDLAAIGTAETIHTVNRGENILMLFINNAIYGMTGGQMAPTTLLNQVTSTSPYGRNGATMGYPLKITEMLVQLPGAYYVTRQSVHTVNAVRKLKKAVEKSFEYQKLNRGTCFIEVVSNCPSGWKMTPLESNKWLEENMFPLYPVGDLKVPGK